MHDALMTQITYYATEIERLMAERDDYKAKFERLGKAGEAYFVEQRAMIAHLRLALAARDQALLLCLNALRWYSYEDNWGTVNEFEPLNIWVCDGNGYDLAVATLEDVDSVVAVDRPPYG